MDIATVILCLYFWRETSQSKLSSDSQKDRWPQRHNFCEIFWIFWFYLCINAGPYKIIYIDYIIDSLVFHRTFYWIRFWCYVIVIWFQWHLFCRSSFCLTFIITFTIILLWGLDKRNITYASVSEKNLKSCLCLSYKKSKYFFFLDC